jgi:hypothetical protein
MTNIFPLTVEDGIGAEHFLAADVLVAGKGFHDQRKTRFFLLEGLTKPRTRLSADCSQPPKHLRLLLITWIEVVY